MLISGWNGIKVVVILIFNTEIAATSIGAPKAYALKAAFPRVRK